MKMMTKSLIEQELEIKTYLVNNDELIGTTETYPDSNKRLMFMSRMNNGIKVYKKKDVDLIIHKAREELKKYKFCWLCKANELHGIKLAHLPHKEVITLEDIEKVMGK